MIPPPTYDPNLVADAILAAATRPYRTITVGGTQVLLGTHFPSILDRLSKLLIPTLSAPGRPRNGEAALFGSVDAGRERSGEQPGRRPSFYTAAEPQPRGGAARHSRGFRDGRAAAQPATPPQGLNDAVSHP